MDLFLIIFLSLIGLIDFRISGLNYWDEFILILGLVLYIVYKVISKRRINNRMFIHSILWIYTVLLVIGLIGNILYPNFQNDKSAIFKDIIAFSKFPLLAMIAPVLLSRKTKNKNTIVLFCKAYIVVLFVFSLVGYFIDIGVYIEDPTKPLRTFQFYFQHCTFMVSTVLCLVTILISTGFRKHRAYILIGCFVMIMSQRTKAIFVSALIVLLMFVGLNRLSILFKRSGDYIKTKKGHIIPAALVLVIAAWLFARGRVNLFWQYGLSAARPALYMKGINIAQDMFPVGSGFASFASSLSGEYYSGVYARYGISAVIGLTKESFAYMADAFPPYIYGQFGFLGLALYILMIYRTIKYHMRLSVNYNTLAAILVLWLYMIFASTAETVFTNATSVQFAMMIPLILKLGNGTLSNNWRGSRN